VKKKIGTKTIHVNGLLRLSLYSKRFGAANPAAPPSFERRMAHLTGKNMAIDGRSAPALLPSPKPIADARESAGDARQPVADDRQPIADHRAGIMNRWRMAAGRTDPFGCRPVRSSSKMPGFFRTLANCLELRRAVYHYSVTSRHTTTPWAFGRVGCRPFNDEVFTSKRGATTIRVGKGLTVLRSTPRIFTLVRVQSVAPGARAQGGDE